MSEKKNFDIFANNKIRMTIPSFIHCSNYFDLSLTVTEQKTSHTARTTTHARDTHSLSLYHFAYVRRVCIEKKKTKNMKTTTSTTQMVQRGVQQCLAWLCLHLSTTSVLFIAARPNGGASAMEI